MVGEASARGQAQQYRRVQIVRGPSRLGWGWWDPWDSYGYGYGYGLGYGYSSRYGLGSLSRFGPYGRGYGAAGYGGGAGSLSSGRMGSVRLRVDPSSAQVYVDGALAGTVDEFNGLTSHLELAAGSHQLELRAAGYRPYQVQITVTAGRTTTERATLQRN